MADSKTAVKWNASFSWLRSLACIAIVVLHTMSYSLVAAGAQGYEVSARQHIGVLLAQYSCLWAVPVFVMVTGALLLDPAREMTWEHLRKRYIGRIGKAVLVFGLFFIAFDLVMNGVGETANNSLLFAAHPVSMESPSVATCLYVILCSVGDLLTGHSWPHMWYLYMLFGLYLLMPYFRKVVANSNEKELRYLVCLLIVFIILLPLLGLANVSTDFRFSVATVYPLYLLLGYALQNRVIRVPRWAAWTGLVISTVGILLAVWFLHQDAATLSIFTSYNSILVALQSASIFTLFTQQNRKREDLPKPLKQFDKCTFGIYLIHFVFVKLLLRYAHWNPFADKWLFLVIVLVIIAASLTLTHGYLFVSLKNRYLMFVKGWE